MTGGGSGSQERPTQSPDTVPVGGIKRNEIAPREQRSLAVDVFGE